MALLVAALAALLGATLQSSTGFGFALVAAPLLVATLGPRTAVSTMAVLALLVTLLTLVGERQRPRVDRQEAVALVLCSAPGLVAGALVLRVAPERALKVLVALAVLTAVALQLRPRRARSWSPRRSALIGLTSGIMSSSTGIGGPPIVFHLLARGWPAAQMRDTLAVIWLAVTVISATVLLATGVFALPAGMPLLLVTTAVGSVIGRRVFAALYGERYERVVLVVLAVTALGALVAAVT